MLQNVFILITVLGLGLGLPSCAPANSAPQNQAPAQTLPATHAAILEIIQTGDKANTNKDAQALSRAATLLTQIGAKPMDGNTPDLAKKWEGIAQSLEPTPKEPPFRGRTKGPAYHQKILAGGAQEILEEVYYASEKAELTLKILSGGKLDLVVREQSAEITEPIDAVCTLNAKANTTSCQWLPLWTAKYNITIVNHSQEPVPYLLVTN